MSKLSETEDRMIRFEEVNDALQEEKSMLLMDIDDLKK